MLFYVYYSKNLTSLKKKKKIIIIKEKKKKKKKKATSRRKINVLKGPINTRKRVPGI
jgi:hypothetical protein